jgi:DNA-binding NtrC family response regulator
MRKARVYVVDDERIIRVTLADELREAGYTVKEFAEPRAALSLLSDEPADFIISDLKMPGMDGVAFLQEVKTRYPSITVVMMTAYATVGSAVEAMKLGAADYLIKPFQPSEMLLVLERLLEIREIREENRMLKRRLNLQYDFSSFIGSEKFTSSLASEITLLLENKTTVLISGETGTGKELLTNIIHHNSNRKSGPLVKVSCAILSKEIFESELFGHVKGAFTGAEKEKTGRFELADGGTLYLDDIDDMPLDLQVKLLRVLEEGEIELVGSSVPKKVDVRIIASTKANLLSKVQEGTFREDLYYRLNVFPVLIPPLRERSDDIEVLCQHFTDISQADHVLIDPEVR